MSSPETRGGRPEPSLREKVGQLIVAGWSGTDMTPELRTLIERYRIGGLSLLPRNLVDAGQTAALTHALQRLAAAANHPAPLWLAADQEGGAILAVRDGLTPFPGNMALGATRDPELAYRVGRALAEEAAALGINVNYAPVLDVNSNPENPIIGVRSFGEDPSLVAELGVAFARGTLAAGVLAVGKHFPGHGDTSLDSHLALPVVHRTLAAAERLELVPFRAAVESGIPALMTSHVLFDALDPEYPATLSPAVLTGLLRKALGFGGLLFTDCLEMAAIAARWPVEDFAVLAVKAGADLLLISHSPDRQVAAVEALVRAVESGEISEERIDQSFTRIMAAKRRWIKPTTGRLPGDWDAIRREHEALEDRVARAAVTLVRSDGLVPLNPTARVVAVWPRVVPRARTDDPAEVCPLGATLRRHAADVREVQFPPVLEEGERVRVAAEVAAAAGSDGVLVIGTATSRPAEAESQGRLVRQLLGLGRPAVVAALRNPYDLRQFPECRNYFACYSYQPAMLRALADVLFGLEKPRGFAPVTLPAGGGSRASA